MHAMVVDVPADATAARKAELRHRMRLVRDTIDDRLIRSVQMWASLAELPEYQRASTVMAYVGIGGEPDTGPLLARIAADGKQAVLPRVVGAVIEAAAGAPTRTGPFGIPEPDGEAVDPATIDLVVVPGLAFTTDGRRLGQGKGYYDRFLPTTAAATVAACFVEHVVDDLPTDSHDLRIGRLITG
jgi:5-formyltetrahydrofolate cyclo-ligase